MIHQNGIRFHDRFAFHEDYGLPTVEEEAESLGKSISGKDVLFMSNHGMYGYPAGLKPFLRSIFPL